LKEKATSGTPDTKGLLAMITGPRGPGACRKAAFTQPRLKPNWTSHQLKLCSHPNTVTAAPGGKIITDGKKGSGPARRFTAAVTVPITCATPAGVHATIRSTRAARPQRTIQSGRFVIL
jgi:hypothetical protein